MRMLLIHELNLVRPRGRQLLLPLQVLEEIALSVDAHL